MKAKDAVVLWNSKETAKADGGPFEVRVVQHGTRLGREYRYSSGAAYTAFAREQPKNQAMMLMALAMELIVFYGLPPQQVDVTLKQIDEYREYAYRLPGSWSC